MPAETPLDADPMLECLLRHAVRFVVIGGYVAIVHGSPFPTEGLDITPDVGSDNLARRFED